MPVLIEPMQDACGAATTLFDLPVVTAKAQQLPVRHASFETAWSLGVLCTTDQKSEMVAELARVLVPGGRLAMLVLVREAATLSVQPEGNSFPTWSEVQGLLEEAGLELVEHVDDRQLPPAPVSWQERTDEVSALIAHRHGASAAWQQAEANSVKVGALLRAEEVRVVLLHAVRT